VAKAPPKPTQPPCAYCDRAYWGWNGSEWYARDRVTKKRHVCVTPAAKQAQKARAAEVRARERRLRSESERARKARLTEARAAERARATRSQQRWKVGLWSIVIAALIGWGAYDYATGPAYNGPPGGTAECEDGTISYSQHRQGTCSWHGGVEAWNE